MVIDFLWKLIHENYLLQQDRRYCDLITVKLVISTVGIPAQQYMHTTQS